MQDYYLDLMSDCINPALGMNLVAQRQIDDSDYPPKRTAEDIDSELTKLISANKLLKANKAKQREAMRDLSLGVPTHKRHHNEKSAFMGISDLCKTAELLFVFTNSYDKFLKQVPELGEKVYTALAGTLSNLKSVLNNKSVSAALKAQAV